MAKSGKRGTVSAVEVIARLKKVYPDTKTALDFSTPLEMLVATILSAQCTDVMVNRVTPAVFGRYTTAAEYAAAAPADLQELIRPTGFFRNKAKNIIASAAIIAGRFGGEVPRTMAELVTLPGVARKTANVVLSEAYGVIAGIAVDTHVKRLSNRLGLSGSGDPERIERDLMAALPHDDWYAACNTLIYHGRRVCFARNPKCDQCVLADICPSAFKV